MLSLEHLPYFGASFSVCMVQGKETVSLILESGGLLVFTSVTGHITAVLLVLALIVNELLTPRIRGTGRVRLRRLAVLLGVLLLSGVSLVVILSDLMQGNLPSVAG
jgi:hypothetical protein